jgi:hypothetical protein
MAVNIKANFGYPNISVIPSDGVIISVCNYPVSHSVCISYDEAAELAQQLMDAVSAHVEKLAA